MHPDNKLTNHGKQVSSDSQSQLPNVTQGANKGLGVGNHGLKANQISPGNPGLKAVNQSVSGIGGMMKTKRERSVSMESGEQQDTLTSLLETGAKVEGVMRSKRRCVLEKKQPYSGDEWCSGPDTEEEDDKPHTVAHRERVMSSGIRQGLSGPSSTTGPLPPDSSLTPGVGRGLGPGGHRSEVPRPSQQVVYVFTTSLANSAAEAVIHGHTDSILLFHQQNVPRTKQLEQYAPSGKHPSLSELSSRATPPTGTPKSQSGTPRPASVGAGVGSHLQSVRSGTPSSTGPPESETPQTRPGGPGASNNSSSGPSLQPGGAIAPTPSGTGSGGGGEGDGTSPSGSPSVLSSHLQSDVGPRGGSGPGANREDGGLSREQLEHRERSLQTLRDIERLLLRSGTAGGSGEPPGPGDDDNNNNNSNVNNNNNRVGGGPAEDSDNAGSCDNNGGGAPLLTPGGQVKRYEEPLQSMVSQTQQLGGPGLDDSPMRGAHHHHHHHHHHHLPPHHHHLHSPGGLDMGPLLGPDGLTPEQVAWRKLQEEYYQEKRRQQEIQPSPHTHPQHFRMMQEMGIGHGGPAIMMRGPPPPYHSKPGEQQWGSGGPMMGPGGMGPGNPRMIDMHPDGPRGPRFLGQMQRGGGFPGSPGGVLAMEGLGPQRGPRPGMWIEDLPPNMMGGGGGPFYHGGPGGGPQQHLQGDPERLLTREEMFRIMEKRQLQGLHRLELERIAKQQQQGMGGPRMMEGPVGFPSQGMGRGPGSRGDPMDFPGSREMMGSPGGGGPQMRDLMDSPLGPVGMGMNVMNQQMMLQKMRGGGGGGPLGDMLSQEDIARIRAAQNGGGRGGGKVMNQGPDGPLQFPNQGPFPGGPGGGDGGYLQGHGAEMFGGPDQHEGPHMGGTSRLSHMPMGGRPRGHPSDLSINVNPGMLSPAMPPPPHQLKSPPLTQEPSPLMSSPSAPGLKSPSQVSSGGGPQAQQHPLPPASGAGTPSSMKSPQVMGPSLGLRSPSGSPGRLKSPALVSSPGWTSPKTALPSPGGPVSGKGVGNGGSSSTETGPSLPPRSSNSTPISQPGSMAPSMPFTSSPDNPPTQNPLSLIMSQMSKYAMPSSTPLYHDAIKTIATSDDEMTPDRPLLSGVNIGGNLGNHQGSMLLSQSSMGPHSGPQSPLGMVLQGPSQLSPNHMGLPGMNPSMMGGGGGPPDGMGSSMSPMHPHNQMGGFPRMQNPSHGGPLHSPLGGLPPQFSQQNPDDVIPPLQHMLSKGLPHPQQHAPPPSDSFMGPEGPDLSDVIRPTHSGIPEFDLSRIIPSDKPSSTLQYFPKGEGQGGPPNPQQGRPGSQGPPPQLLKQLSAPSSNPHIANLQNMMAEQQLPPLPSHCGMGRPGMAGGPQGGSRGMGGPGGGCMMPPGHLMGRTGMGPGPGGQQLHQHHQHHQQQQAMMANSLLHPGPHPSMMSPQHQQHHSMMTQQNLMLMQVKQRSMGLPGDPFGQQGGPLMSPGGPMMGPGPQHPQGGMMGPGAGPQGPLRQRGMSLDSPLGYGPGPGSMTNMPF